MKKTSLLALTLLAGIALVGAGCGHSETAHDHSHGPGEHHDHDHGTVTGGGTGGQTGAVTNTIAGIQYTCPMHPEVVQNTPGTCPKCQMNLVEKK